jgi:hypothetical protein
MEVKVPISWSHHFSDPGSEEILAMKSFPLPGFWLKKVRMSVGICGSFANYPLPGLNNPCGKGKSKTKYLKYIVKIAQTGEQVQ